MKICCHIVTYQEPRYLNSCLDSLRKQTIADDIFIQVTHNGDFGAQKAQEVSLEHGVTFFHNSQNLGFCAAHNQGVGRFLASGDSTFLLILNSDLSLKHDAVELLVKQCEKNEEIGIACPLLLRSDDKLQPLDPALIDCAGMTFTTSLRHFDRYAEERLDSLVLKEEEVSGASGACMLLSKRCVQDLIFTRDDDSALRKIFSCYFEENERREELFDEGFFAYREDAELSLRARSYGWRVLFSPNAVGYHVRKVTPERRSELPSAINSHSVRNRFLLQCMHFSPVRDFSSLFMGFVVRNVLVVAAILVSERSSFVGFLQAIQLAPRAFRRRAEINRKRKVSGTLWTK